MIFYNCIGAFEVPDRRKIPEQDILLETRKGVALASPRTDCHIELRHKNAEYHQKNFSDPLMILRMVGVADSNPRPLGPGTKRYQASPHPERMLPIYYSNFFLKLSRLFQFMLCAIPWHTICDKKAFFLTIYAV